MSPILLSLLVASSLALYLPVQVGVVQTNGRTYDRDRMPSVNDKVLNLELMAAKVAYLSSRGAKLIVFPEMFLTGYSVGDLTPLVAELKNGPSFLQVAQIAQTYHVTIVYGYPEKRTVNGVDVVYNSQNIVGEDGSLLGTHSKTHLFGPGEAAHFAAEDNLNDLPIEIYGLKWSFLICFEVEFPETARIRKLQGADVLVVSTANMVPWEGVNLFVIAARAYENTMFVLYVNHVGADPAAPGADAQDWVGLTTVADPGGNSLVMLSDHREESAIATIDKQYWEDYFGGWTYLADRRPELYGLITAPK